MFEKLLAALLARLTPARLKEVSTYIGGAIIGAPYTMDAELQAVVSEFVATVLPASWAGYELVIVYLLTTALGVGLILMRGKKAEGLQSPAWVALLAVGLLLSACGAAGMNKQQYAGINQVSLQTGGGCAAEDRTNQDTCQLKMIDGKEKATVMIKVILADGTTYEYSAGEEKAFEGQAKRADVDKAVVEKVGEVASEVIDAVTPPELPE